MVTFLITTSLYIHPIHCEIVDKNYIPTIYKLRNEQYTSCIPEILEFAKEINARCFLLENNGKRDTVLDLMGCDVLYTNNNFLNTQSKGIKEIVDIYEAIHTLNIPDDELIVKVTGRYKLDTNGSFCKELRTYNSETTDCIVRYGWYGDTSDESPHEDCLTGLIAMKCKYIKQILIENRADFCIEHQWAKASLLAPHEKIRALSGKIGYRMHQWDGDGILDL